MLSSSIAFYACCFFKTDWQKRLSSFDRKKFWAGNNRWKHTAVKKRSDRTRTSYPLPQCAWTVLQEDDFYTYLLVISIFSKNLDLMFFQRLLLLENEDCYPYCHANVLPMIPGSVAKLNRPIVIWRRRAYFWRAFFQWIQLKTFIQQQRRAEKSRGKHKYSEQSVWSCSMVFSTTVQKIWVQTWFC